MKTFLCGDIFVLNEEKVIQKIEARLQKMGMKYIYQAYDYNIVLFYFLGYTDQIAAPDFYAELNEGIKDKIERVNLSMNTEENTNTKILLGDWDKIKKDDKFISIDILPTYSFEFIEKNLLKNMIGNCNYKVIIKRVGLQNEHLGKNLIRIDIIF